MFSQAKIELIEAAKRGDEEAMETLTIGEYNEAALIAERVMTEDVYSVIDTTFMPCGVESDHYSVLGTILETQKVQNRWTGETVHVLTVDCNDIIFDVAINDADLAGIPEAAASRARSGCRDGWRCRIRCPARASGSTAACCLRGMRRSPAIRSGGCSDRSVH